MTTTLVSWITPVLPRGCLPHSGGFFPCRFKTKRKWPKPSRWSILHPSPSFYFRVLYIRINPLLRPHTVSLLWLWERVSKRVKFKIAILKKNLACMILKLTLYVSKVISLYYKLNIRYLERFWQTFDYKKWLILYYMSAILRVGQGLWRYCDKIR